jgi:hypothetical protein
MARKKRRSNPWTTGEMRLMRQLHENERPVFKDLLAHFPRHPPKSVMAVASNMGLRKPVGNVTRLEWAREYLTARPGLLAYLGISVPEAAE